MPTKHPSAGNGSRRKAFHHSARVLLVLEEVSLVWRDQQGGTSITNGLGQGRGRQQANGAREVQTANIVYMSVEVRSPVESIQGVGRATSSNLEITNIGRARH